ncbi:MAG: PEGA domain-containing protein, partial [Pseudomonadota bacterium]
PRTGETVPFGPSVVSASSETKLSPTSKKTPQHAKTAAYGKGMSASKAAYRGELVAARLISQVRIQAKKKFVFAGAGLVAIVLTLALVFAFSGGSDETLEGAKAPNVIPASAGNNAAVVPTEAGNNSAVIPAKTGIHPEKDKESVNSRTPKTESLEAGSLSDDKAEKARTDSSRTTSRLIWIHSVPNGAQVFLQGKEVGHTPMRLSLDPNLPAIEIALSKKGFVTERTTIRGSSSSPVRISLKADKTSDTDWIDPFIHSGTQEKPQKIEKAKGKLVDPFASSPTQRKTKRQKKAKTKLADPFED